MNLDLTRDELQALSNAIGSIEIDRGAGHPLASVWRKVREILDFAPTTAELLKPVNLDDA